jgi:hypothetical protein
MSADGTVVTQVKLKPDRTIEVAVSMVSKPEQKVLDAIAWFESIGQKSPKKISVAFLAGYSGSSGGSNNLCGMLRTKWLIKYQTPGTMSLTDEGKTVANPPENAPTTAELHQKVMALLPTPEGRVLSCRRHTQKVCRSKS